MLFDHNALDGRIPQLPAVVKRRRLLQRLESVLQYKLTLLCAPPGYGKTTLAAQFAQTLSCPVVWHSVEEHERDVPNLHAKSLAALDDLIPGIQSLTFTKTKSVSELATSVANYVRGAI